MNFSQINKNCLSFSNSINSVYKKNGVLKTLDEIYGKSFHTEFNIQYSRNLLTLNKFSLDLGPILNCEYLTFKFNNYSYSRNWYLYPGLKLKTTFILSRKTRFFIQGNQYSSGLFLQRIPSNSYKNKKNVIFSSEPFSKADLLIGINYQFLQKEKYELGINLAFGSNLYTHTDEFFYRYYINYGLLYSF